MSIRVAELHSIQPIANVISILEKGILSNELAKKIKHVSIAMPEVQEKRDAIPVPNGLKLHQYANLYFHARNPMMYSRKHEKNLCILRISHKALQIEDAVLTDGNASSRYTRFYSLNQIDEINFDLVYAENWQDEYQVEYWRKKRAKCAEVLVPYQVPPHLILGAYAPNEEIKKHLSNLSFVDKSNIITNPNLFFLGDSHG